MDADLPLELPRHDYVSPGLAIVRPDAAFPDLIVGDTQVPRWRWLRRWVEQNWYTDRRNPDVGFLNRDEAAILHNAARLVRGKPCLEIGSWLGWSAVHLALGSGVLDVIDPIIANPTFAERIRQSCKAAGVLDAITFHAGVSPAAVDALGNATGKKWSLIFVDGDHEGDAPCLDAEAAMRHAADTAMVLFHDLVSPHVAAGLNVMRNAGWRTMVYQTMQIMGVAWRGDIQPPAHTPDPNIFWTLPSHLAGYHVSGWKPPTIRADGGWWAGMTMADRRDAAMMRAQTAEDVVTTFEGDAGVARQEIARGETLIADLRMQLAALEAKLARRDAQIADAAIRLAALQTEVATLQERVPRKPPDLEIDDPKLTDFVRFITERRVLLGLLRRSARERFEAVRLHATGVQINHLLPDELLHRLLRRRTLLGLARRSKLAGEAIVANAVAQSLRSAETHSFDDLPGQSHHLAAESGGDTLSSHLRSVGWGPNEPSLSKFPGPLLREYLANSALGEEAELAWVKRVISGWHPPADAVALQTAAAGVRDSALFDPQFYKRQTGIKDDAIDPATHYVLIGDALGLSPSESFDAAYYGERNPDVVTHGLNRLLHYLASGRREGRHPFPPGMTRINKRRMNTRRENVILVVHEASRTGAPILAWNIARHLTARYNLFTVTLGGGPLTEDFKALSAEIYGPLELGPRHPADIECGLRRLLDERTYKYAIINSCESRPAIEACARRLIPTVMLMHEFGSYVSPSDTLRAAFDMASEIVFPAQIVARSSLRVHPPLRERPIRILAQGVTDLPAGTTAPSAQCSRTVDALARARHEGAFIVLGAGTVEYRKGVDLFLATSMAVHRDAAGRRVQFLWVGRGYRPDDDVGYSIYLFEQLERSGLRDQVTFLDEVSDLQPIYALADAFLLTSRLDPLPNVSIDAAHRGIPIICFRDASGTADLLLSDPDTAGGVVDYLDPIAAGRVILSLARDRDYYERVATATKRLARSTFDMAKYVEAIDALGRAASVDVARKHEDIDLLCRTDDFDQDLFLGPEPVFESRARTIRRAVVEGSMRGGRTARRTAPGFNPRVWQLEHPESSGGDPLAEFVRAGRPIGPWFTPVLRPAEDPARLEAPGIRALLHVHLANTERAANLLMRIQTNRLRFDLLVTIDTELKAALLRVKLGTFGRGAMHVVAAEVEGESAVTWLLSKLQRPEWSSHDVVGHLHDGGDHDDDVAVDFQWTALLGGRHPMLDRVLHAFAYQSTLGLVFPSDPLLPGSDVTVDYPSGGMFFARRATLDRLRNADLTSANRLLPQACEAAGLMQAVTHVPGVFR